MKFTKEHLQQIIKEEIEAVLKEKEGPKYVRDDAYVAKYDPAFRKEVCLGRKRNGEFVDWFVRDGKGRCEYVTLDESISNRFALGKDSDMAAMMKAREAEEMKLKNQAEMDGRTDGFAGTEDKYDFWENEGEVYLRHYMIGLTDAQDEQEYYDDDLEENKMKITKEQLQEIIKGELSEMFAAGGREQRDPIDTEYVNLIRKLGARSVIIAIIDNLGVDDDAHRSVIDSLKASMPEMAEGIEDEVQEARRERETPAQKRERSKRERRDAELRSQGKPEWQSGQPGVTTTSLKDLKKMMNQNK